MAYSRTVWQDKIKDETGQIIQEGTPLSAQNMNNIEAGIEENTEQLLTLTQDITDTKNRLEELENLSLENNENIKEELKYITSDIDKLAKRAMRVDINLSTTHTATKYDMNKNIFIEHLNTADVLKINKGKFVTNRVEVV